MEKLKDYPWWGYLEDGQRDAIATSFILLEREKTNPTLGVRDFSFIVFPAAKAYEGFLKKLFFDLGFISREEFEGRRFRIGRALNPALERQFRQESIYDKLAAFCQGRELPDKLWQTWKTCRNLLFHWWPASAKAMAGEPASRGEPAYQNFITLGEAEERIKMIIDTINSAFAECKVKG